MRTKAIFAVLVTAAALAAPVPSHAVVAPPVAGADFNGDGYADLAVGVPFESIGDLPLAGAVNVLYGSANGLTGARGQQWHQNVAGVVGAVESYDLFGAALAAGDFDDDGYADLAIGVPSETYGTVKKQGVVHVLYGSATGLTAAGDQMFAQGLGGVPANNPRGWEGFGEALAVGDFDADSKDDLAVGVPGDEHRGSVQILRGGTNGLTPGALFMDPNNAWLGGYGAALAAGNFDGTGGDDLAVGEPGDGEHYLGAVWVLYGSSGTGLSQTAASRFDENTPGLTSAHDGDFGIAVAAGDIDHDGKAELAITDGFSGVDVLPGTPSGPAANGSTTWTQDSPNVPGSASPGDAFGVALAIADLNADGFGDLAVGAPLDDEDDGDYFDSGSVTVLYGSASGLTATGAQLWDQNTPGVPGTSYTRDIQGATVAIGDFDDDGKGELVMGTPGESFSGQWRAGGITVLRGAASGATTAGAVLLTQNTPGVPGVAEAHDFFALALAT